MFDAEKCKDVLRKEAENAYGLIHNADILAGLKEGDLLFIDNSGIRNPGEKDIGDIGYLSEVRGKFDDRGSARGIQVYFKPNTCHLLMFDGDVGRFVSTFTHSTVYGGSQLFTEKKDVDQQLRKYSTNIEEFLKLKV